MEDRELSTAIVRVKALLAVLESMPDSKKAGLTVSEMSFQILKYTDWLKNLQIESTRKGI